MNKIDQANQVVDIVKSHGYPNASLSIIDEAGDTYESLEGVAEVADVGDTCSVQLHIDLGTEILFDVEADPDDEDAPGIVKLVE